MLWTITQAGNPEPKGLHPAMLFVPEPTVHPVRYSWLLQYTYNFSKIGPAIDALEGGVRTLEGQVNRLHNMARGKDSEKHHSYTMALTIGILRQQLAHYRAELAELTTYPNAKRGTRALFPFIGSWSHDLFGTATEDEIDEIKRAVARQSQNTKKMKLALNQVVSAVNISRHFIEENRGAIELVMKQLDAQQGFMDTQLLNLRKQQARHGHVSHLASLVSKMHTLVTALGAQFDNFRQTMNIMRLGRISVSAYSPMALSETLKEIQQRLPTGRMLAIDPVRDVGEYYDLQAVSIFHGDCISVLIPVPVVDTAEALEVFRVMALPVYSHPRRVIAQYVPESNYIVVNKLQTHGSHITDAQFLGCRQEHCHLSVPMIPLRQAPSCVLAQYAQKDTPRRAVPATCRMTITATSEKFARADLVTSTFKSATWAYIAAEDSPLTVNCYDHAEITKQVIYPDTTLPMNYIQLPRGCAARNELLDIPAAEFDHVHAYHDQFQFNFSSFIGARDTDFDIWNHMANRTTHISNMSWPRLGKIESIPMDTLVTQLNEIDGSEPLWYTSDPVKIGVPGGVAGLLVIVLIVVTLCRARSGPGSTYHHPLTVMAPPPVEVAHSPPPTAALLRQQMAELERYITHRPGSPDSFPPAQHDLADSV